MSGAKPAGGAAAPPPAGGAPAGGAAPPAAGGDANKPDRPLGPDGKPIPGPEQMRQIQAARKMTQQQAQVEEVIGIMHKNVENVLERDAKLGALEERADALQDGCAQFEKQAAAMKNKFWLENLKSMIMMGVVGLLVLGVVYWNFFHTPAAPPPQQPYYPPPPPPPANTGGGAAAAGGGDGGDAAAAGGGGGAAADAGDGGGGGGD